MKQSLFKYFEEEVFKPAIEDGLIFSSMENLKSYCKCNKEIVLLIFNKVGSPYSVLLEELLADENTMDFISAKGLALALSAPVPDKEKLTKEELKLYFKLSVSSMFFADKEVFFHSFIDASIEFNTAPDLNLLKEILEIE
jgi:hypothetical protein